MLWVGREIVIDLVHEVRVVFGCLGCTRDVEDRLMRVVHR